MWSDKSMRDRIRVRTLGFSETHVQRIKDAFWKDLHIFPPDHNGEVDVVLHPDGYSPEEVAEFPPHLAVTQKVIEDPQFEKNLLKEIKAIFAHSSVSLLHLTAGPEEVPEKKGFQSPAWTTFMDNLQLLARNSAPVLLLGETGAGKDVAARLIHELSSRSHGPFVPVNGGAIPLTLVESELWGCERGAFTDAVSRPGLFEEAEGGTLFLDEVGELPLEIQVKLLRVLEEGRLRRVGGKCWKKADFRLISATNRPLLDEVLAGRFRKDLYYRLSVLPITVPSLRSRKEDIVPLAEEFLSRVGVGATLTPEVKELLKQHSWPGNVRELKNVIERAWILSRGQDIRPEHIRFDTIT